MSRQDSRRVLLCVAIATAVAAAAATVAALAQQRAAAAMARSGQDFLSSLTPPQRQRAVFPLQSEEWTRWHFIPVSMFERHGLPVKDMTEPQREKARALLAASLSQSGYQTATSIMSLETILGQLEERERTAAAASGGRGPAVLVRDPENYFFSVFGEPSTSSQWGWRLEGHHVSLHFAVDGAKLAVTSTPLFFGSNPAVVPEGLPRAGLRILGPQEDAARALLMALDERQRAQAIVSPTAPGDIISMTKVKADPLNPSGLPAAEMTRPQRDLLMTLIDAYSSAMLADVAADRMSKMRDAGVEKIAFAWFGPTEKGQKYYYRVQGPTFLIEHNNTQNNGNHIHSVWRDFNGDFGRDLLAEHMAAFPH
jgi:Protein of unknown function (DUF3500)